MPLLVKTKISTTAVGAKLTEDGSYPPATRIVLFSATMAPPGDALKIKKCREMRSS